MTPVGKALWFIESHFAQALSLEEIAAAGGVSRYHMAHVFSLTTGLSVMRYVRGRRLSEAAKALASGAPDILTVALDVGYGSHEAFTRAFREQFGVTPEQLRASNTVDHIPLLEAMRMDEQWARGSSRRGGRRAGAASAIAAADCRKSAAGRKRDQRAFSSPAFRRRLTAMLDSTFIPQGAR